MQIQESIAVTNTDTVFSIRFQCDILVDFLHFPQLRSNLTISRHNPVTTEIIVVRAITEAASKIIMIGRLSGHINALIHPIPDASSDHTFRMVFDIIPVFFQITNGVAHRMSIFTKEIRLVTGLLVLFDHTFNRRIHTGIHIGHIVHSFIMDITVVYRFGCLIGSLKVTTTTGLIAH